MNKMTPKYPAVKAKLNVLAKADGGRDAIPDGPCYRPHIVIGDPDQRIATSGPDGRSNENYLGICFNGDGSFLSTGKTHEVYFSLVYFPRVDYSAIVKGATFTLREGGTIVAFGEIISDILMGSVNN